MHLTLLYTLVSTVLVLQPTLAATVPSELQPRACPKQDFDPKGYLCGGDSGMFSNHSLPRSHQNRLVLYSPSKGSKYSLHCSIDREGLRRVRRFVRVDD